MCKQQARQHYQTGHECIEEKRGVRVQTGTHSYLRQSGGKEELFIPHYVNEQKIHQNPCKASHGTQISPAAYGEYKQCHLRFKE